MLNAIEKGINKHFPTLNVISYEIVLNEYYK